MSRSIYLILTLLSLGLFVAGCFAPLFTLSKFFIFNNTVSLFSALQEILTEGYYFLFLIIFLFSVLFPLIKLFLLFYLQQARKSTQQKHRKLLHWLEVMGKWSMLDVFVVAVMLVAIKLGPMANVQVHYGVYLFSASIILMMLTSMMFGRQISR